MTLEITCIQKKIVLSKFTEASFSLEQYGTSQSREVSIAKRDQNYGYTTIGYYFMDFIFYGY